MSLSLAVRSELDGALDGGHESATYVTYASVRHFFDDVSVK